jgi:hypothetical protein
LREDPALTFRFELAPSLPPFAGPYFGKAKAALLGMQALQQGFAVEVVEHPDRDTFQAWWTTEREVRQIRVRATTSG